MELQIQKSSDTPLINFNISKKIFEIGGKSLPEDADDFYRPILEWIKNNKSLISAQSELSFKMDYYNTASSKRILDIISQFKDIHDSGKEIIIKWFYAKDDTDMLLAGEEIEEIIEFPLNKIMI